MVSEIASDATKRKNPDREIWVRETILTAIKMGIEISKIAVVRADEQLLHRGIEGIADGAAVEIHGQFHCYDLVNLKPSLRNGGRLSTVFEGRCEGQR